jgi:hypothetical protein
MSPAAIHSWSEAKKPGLTDDPEIYAPASDDRVNPTQSCVVAKKQKKMGMQLERQGSRNYQGVARHQHNLPLIESGTRACFLSECSGICVYSLLAHTKETLSVEDSLL